MGLEITTSASPDEQANLARIRERFYRAPGAAGQGAGLGLS